MNECLLPSDIISIVFEYAPSCTLSLLQSQHDDRYCRLILQAPNIWKQFSLNLCADLDRMSRNNPQIRLQSISIPNSRRSLFYFSGMDECICLNIYLRVDANDKIDPFLHLLIPIEFVKKIRIFSPFLLDFLANYLSKMSENKRFWSRLQIEMDCFVHIRSLTKMEKIKNLIINNCDLTRQFSSSQANSLCALPNVEVLTLCRSVVSFYSSTLTAIHCMLLSKKYLPFFKVWERFSKLKTIIIAEAKPNAFGLHEEMKRTAQCIQFPANIQNLWFPHSPCFDLKLISCLSVLCLDRCHLFVNELGHQQECMMHRIELNETAEIEHLFVNVAIVKSANIEKNEWMKASDLFKRAKFITFNCCVSLSNGLIQSALQSAIPMEKWKNVRFMSDNRLFQARVHSAMSIENVFDEEYEQMIHGKRMRSDENENDHLDLIDDILRTL